MDRARLNKPSVACTTGAAAERPQSRQKPGAGKYAGLLVQQTANKLAYSNVKLSEEVGALRAQIADLSLKNSILEAKLQSTQAAAARASSGTDLLELSLAESQAECASAREKLDAMKSEKTLEIEALQAQHDSLVATLVEKHKRELCAVKLEAECLLMKHTQTHQAAAVAARIRAENTVALASSAQVSHQEALRAQQTEAEARMQSCQEAANALASTMQVSMALALKEVEEEQIAQRKALLARERAVSDLVRRTQAAARAVKRDLAAERRHLRELHDATLLQRFEALSGGRRGCYACDTPPALDGLRRSYSPWTGGCIKGCVYGRESSGSMDACASEVHVTDVDVTSKIDDQAPKQEAGVSPFKGNSNAETHIRIPNVHGTVAQHMVLPMRRVRLSEVNGLHGYTSSDSQLNEESVSTDVTAPGEATDSSDERPKHAAWTWNERILTRNHTEDGDGLPQPTQVCAADVDTILSSKLGGAPSTILSPSSSTAYVWL